MTPEASIANLSLQMHLRWKTFLWSSTLSDRDKPYQIREKTLLKKLLISDYVLRMYIDYRTMGIRRSGQKHVHILM